MLEWIQNLINSTDSAFVLFPGLFLLGCIISITSCCNIAAIGAIAGYAGTRENKTRYDGLIAALSFMIGTVLALTAMGIAAGYIGELVSGSFGRYGKLLIGMISVLFGLMALKLLPFKLPGIGNIDGQNTRGLTGMIIFGFALGAGTSACTTACVPVLPVVLGVAVLQGETLRSAMIMLFFALGYSLPLAAVFLGISFGKWTLRANRFMPYINSIAGIVLIFIGFYFLATL